MTKKKITPGGEPEFWFASTYTTKKMYSEQRLDSKGNVKIIYRDIHDDSILLNRDAKRIKGEYQYRNALATFAKRNNIRDYQTARRELKKIREDYNKQEKKYQSGKMSKEDFEKWYMRRKNRLFEENNRYTNPDESKTEG